MARCAARLLQQQMCAHISPLSSRVEIIARYAYRIAHASYAHIVIIGAYKRRARITLSLTMRAIIINR